MEVAGQWVGGGEDVPSRPRLLYDPGLVRKSDHQSQRTCRSEHRARRNTVMVSQVALGAVVTWILARPARGSTESSAGAYPSEELQRTLVPTATPQLLPRVPAGKAIHGRKEGSQQGSQYSWAAQDGTRQRQDVCAGEMFPAPLSQIPPDPPALLRDEEAAGSNPATPTQVRGPFLIVRGGPFRARASLVRQDAASTTR